MKTRVYIVFVLLSFLMMLNMKIVTASEMGLIIEELPSERKDFFMNHYSIEKRTDGRPHELGFFNYDVNENGEIVLSSEMNDTKNTKIIHIYSSDGKYKKGFELGYRGRMYVDWVDCNSLHIYLESDATMLTIDADGKVMEAVYMGYSYENSQYLKNEVCGQEKTVNTCHYVATKNLGPLNLIQPCFSKLICFDENGQEKTIYDVTVWQFLKTIPFVIVLIFIFPIGGYMVLKIIKQTEFVNKK